eukprot:scaffold658981_cov104-Prasinocladus_malaysianus.AAC.1
MGKRAGSAGLPFTSQANSRYRHSFLTNTTLPCPRTPGQQTAPSDDARANDPHSYTRTPLSSASGSGFQHPSPCPVCLSPLVRQLEGLMQVDSSRVFRTTCGHRFHLPCIGEWVSARPHADCPACRSALHPQTSTELRDFCPVGATLKAVTTVGVTRIQTPRAG